MKITLPAAAVSGVFEQTNKQTKLETDGQRLGGLVRVQSPGQRDPGPFVFPLGGEAGEIRGVTCCLLL